MVIDEQHRFGVEQRDALREKARGSRPHVLVMTATPIPRTVAMTVYGDLDMSTLSELPAGRAPITTHVVPAADKPHYLERTWERLREEVAGGGQAYVVCPRIGAEDGAGGARPRNRTRSAGRGPGGRPGRRTDGDVRTRRGGRRAAAARRSLDMTAELAGGPLAGLRMRMLHGRLPADEKDAAMRAFADGSVDVLVATTVVEVGVDVPNATTMVIMDADRFGVSQLHQLRGRVGRGGKPGLCLLVTDAPEGSPARERLDAVAATVDGFALSRLDLEQRREGERAGRRPGGPQVRAEDAHPAARRGTDRAGPGGGAGPGGRRPGLAGQPALAAAPPRCWTRSRPSSWRRRDRRRPDDPGHRRRRAAAAGWPSRPGGSTRPTSDRAREGLFSTLAALRGPLDGACVLDLYAGSGAVGLEALSRGAPGCCSWRRTPRRRG